MQKLIPDDAVLIPDNAERVFNGVIYDVYQWQQKMHDDSEATFEMLKRPDTVQVIAVVDGNIIIIEDEQPHRGVSISLPGGRVDETDESIVAAAKRELLEETGYECEVWRLLSVKQMHMKIEWFIYYFLATNGKKISESHLDAGEKITVSLRALDEVRGMSIAGEGHLGEARHIFEKCKTLEQLTALPGFKGTTVDR